MYDLHLTQPRKENNIYTRGAAPRRAAARLGSTHALNFRGFMIRIIGLYVNRGCTCDSTAKEYIKSKYSGVVFE